MMISAKAREGPAYLTSARLTELKMMRAQAARNRTRPTADLVHKLVIGGPDEFMRRCDGTVTNGLEPGPAQFDDGSQGTVCGDLATCGPCLSAAIDL